MSGSNSTVSLTLQIKGQQAAQEMKRISDQQIQATTKINTQWTQVASAQAKFVNTAKVGTRETLNTARAGDQLLRTNKMLEGVLRQQSIQTKLQSQLLKQQVGSAQQLANWSKQVEQSSKRTHQSTQQTMSLWQKVSTIGGAAIGAGYALQQPIKRTVDYDRDLHYAAQKLSDSPTDWNSTKDWMNKIVVGNAINGGVDRDQSFLAMDALIANGAYNDNDLQKMKSNLARAHFEAGKSALASGGDILDFAQVGVAAKSRNLNESKVQAMVIKADDLGAMSAKDIAKALPAQLGKLSVDKVNSERAVAQLIALNEIAMKTAGTSGEADTNVQNFLGKMYSSDTIERLKKKQSINLPDRYAAGKNNGKTDFDVFYDVADEILAKDKRMQAIVKKMVAAKNDAQAQAILETQQGIYEQSGLAAILPDQQSLMTLVAIKRYKKQWDEMTDTALTKGEQTRDLKYNYNKTELASVGINSFDVTRKNAEYQTLQDSTKLLGDMGQKVTEITNKYPQLITAMGATELALKALAVAAGGAALGQIVGGKGVVGAASAGAAGTATKAIGGASAVGGVAAAYAGSQLIKPIDDAGYNLVSGLLAKIGIGSGGESPDFVQQAIEQSKAQQASAEEKSSQLIAEQQKQNQLSQEMINKINTLINVTGQNKTINFSGGLLGAISENAAAEEKRHGASNVPFYLQRH
ncbi:MULTISPECIES: hypothetical protein [Acinetobacter calcoaceticus/baumannii complex]|uniref:hypothetical protein n=1 Tax=Acinetobacter calcoaceticus/baumannii complex TaxID=909768 RepID=UPI0002CF0D95|nr:MULTISPECIES: hypothetical protein [Acinetobacter calcoaceticus/baumannii complex]ENW16696.1 hypothetical protein F928_00130 [Acinetobacter pittii ATCC 19004 = CIP 70.29]OCZ19194.1 hypothetical protein BFR96_08705 [Acinetobacter pittii]QXA12977.1 hypothetical protein I6L29_06620 [Acinetobacter pittii]UAB16855.1 hypothetical protein H2786_03630 [Acinetobacter baumannii]